MLSILNQSGFAKYCNKSCVYGQKQKQKITPKDPYRSRGLNPGPPARKADALPLHHRVN